AGHGCSEFRRAEEAGDGLGQIGGSRMVAGDEPADFRQDFGEIPAVQIPEQALWWFTEFENGDGAARLEDTLNFAKACFIVGQIAEAESASYEIKGSIGKRQAEGVGFEKRHSGRGVSAGRRGESCALRFGADKH